MERVDWRTQVPHIDEAGLYLMGELVVANDEAPLQQALVSEIALHASGRVLELGYGLGYSHQAIREIDTFSEHWVIEGNYHLAANCLLSNSNTTKPSVVIGDTWEHAALWLPRGYFNAVVFDPYPFDAAAAALESWREKFTYVAKKARPMLERIIADQGVIGFINFDHKHFTNDVVENCFGNGFKPQTIRNSAPSDDFFVEVWALK